MDSRPRPTLLVLAAGRGSRFAGDKQFAGVGPGGEFILDYSVYDAARAGFGSAVIVISPSMEEGDRAELASRLGQLLPVQLVTQTLTTGVPDSLSIGHRQKPWGTGQAVLAADGAISGPFAVVNADDFYGRSAFEAMAEYLTDPTVTEPVALVGYRLAETLSDHGAVSRGICEIDRLGHLAGVREHVEVRKADGVITGRTLDGVQVELSAEATASMNFWGFRDGMFDSLSRQFEQFIAQHGTSETAEFYLIEAVHNMLQDADASALVLQAGREWFGMTYRDDWDAVKARVRQLVDDGHYPERLYK